MSESNEISFHSEVDSKSSKKRIRVACDHCRRKKIKCDGKLPCGNCSSAKERNCHYKERPIKKKSKPLKSSDKNDGSKRSTKTKSIEVLDSRLSTLENVIIRLTDKLEDITRVVPIAPLECITSSNNSSKTYSNGIDEISDRSRLQNAKHEKSSESESEDENENNTVDEQENDLDRTTSETEDDDDDDGEDEDEDEEEDEHENENDPTSHNLKEQSSKTKAEPMSSSKGPSTTTAQSTSSKAKTLLNNRTLEQYFGIHSILCIFSDKSLAWIEHILGAEGEDLITPIKNVPVVFYSKFKTFMLKWIDPPLIDSKARRRLLENPFPENSKLVFDFIDSHYKDVNDINSLCEQSEMRGYFEQYYNNCKEPNFSKRKKFKLSEYLIMTAGLLLCISSRINLESTASLKTSPVGKEPTQTNDISLSDDELLNWQNTLFDDAIYYYHKVSVISDGITTIEGILLLIMYIEMDWLTSHVNYMLSSVAIRYAQEIGLHRAETYEDLEYEEQDKRRKIWMFCHYFDMEICFRGGKPPLINANDVTANSDEDLMRFCKLKLEHKADDKPLMSLDVNMALSKQMLAIIGRADDPLTYRLYFLLFTRIRAKSYSKLFVASVENETIQKVANTLNNLNTEMFELASSMHEADRPRFFNDPEFSFIPETMPYDRRETVIAVQITFFFHLMVMNRLPTMVNAEELDNSSSMKFRNLHLDSARTILVLVRQLNRENTGVSYYYWILFFPFSAFLCLSAAILNHPNLPESYSDLKLLIDCSMNFFSSKKNSHMEGKSRFKIYSKKDLVVSLIIKLMLKIVIKFYEETTKLSVLAGDDKLQRHLDSAKKMFPDIFKDRAEFNSKVSSVFGISPFTNNQNFSASDSMSGSSNGHAGAPVRTVWTPGEGIPTPVSSSLQANASQTRQFGISPAANTPISFSPSYNPALSNILHPNDLPMRASPSENVTYNVHTPNRLQQQTQHISNAATVGMLPHHRSMEPAPVFSSSMNGENSINGELNAGFISNSSDIFQESHNDDGISSLFYTQMNSLPNFFFDNNLGI